jgi:hypothetical protein
MTNQSPKFLESVMNHVMCTTYWKNYFDIILSACQKPLFEKS